jgi:hypothetical protein
MEQVRGPGPARTPTRLLGHGRSFSRISRRSLRPVGTAFELGSSPLPTVRRAKESLLLESLFRGRLHVREHLLRGLVDARVTRLDRESRASLRHHRHDHRRREQQDRALQQSATHSSFRHHHRRSPSFSPLDVALRLVPRSRLAV